jgi:hypothetical protein
MRSLYRAALSREPRTTTGGVNFVIGFRPELWAAIDPEDAPAGVEGFNKEIRVCGACAAIQRRPEQAQDIDANSPWPFANTVDTEGSSG